MAPDDAIGLANVVARLADDPGACARMGVAAQAMFEAEFTQAIVIAKWREGLEGCGGSC